MFYKRLLALILGVALILIGLSAQSKTVYLHLKSGETISCSISQNPKLTYGENYVRMVSTAMDVEFQMAEIDHLSFSASSSGIEDVKANTEKMRQMSDELRFTGFASESPIVIADASGRMLYSGQVNADGTLSISLTDLPNGILIIKANNKSYKIVKR